MLKPVRIFLLSLVFAVFSSGFASAALYPEGDLTGDCKVDWEDILTFAEQWLDVGSCSHFGCADLDGINGINLADFSVLASHWYQRGIPLVINEFMASNNSESDINDPYGDYDDWLEIYNFGDIALDIGGMYLTDDLDDPTKWQIPEGYPAETNVPADGFILFWADGETYEGPLHASFKLSADGEQIGLFADSNTMIDGISFGEQVSNISYGRYPDANNNMQFFSVPTPLADNNNAYIDIVEQPEFSHERGFYDTGFNVTIATSTNGADIYYTTDGNAPVKNDVNTVSSTKYTSAIHISSNTCLRAAAIKTGWMPSRTTTHTYIFDASDEIKSMPAVCLVGDEYKSLFEPDGIMAIVGGTYVGGVWTSGGPGTYNNPIHRGREYERPVSFEIIDLPAATDFQIDCGIRVHGSDFTRPRYTRGDDWHCNNNKFSFNMFFRSSYGDNRFEFPFFPFTAEVKRHQSIVLRAGMNDICSPFVKDEWMRRLFKEMGGVQETGTFANLYINGDYKSYYNPTGRADNEFYQEWYGTDNDFDVITQSEYPEYDVRDGDDVAWSSLLDYIDSHDLADINAYEYVASKFDIPMFVDYLILQIYSANFDWPNKNWTVHHERSDTGKFRYSVWDLEGIEAWWLGLNCEHCNYTAFEDCPSYFAPPKGLNNLVDPISRLYRALKANPDFRQLFADHIHKHFYNGGVLRKDHLLAKWWEVSDEVSPVITTIPWDHNFIPNTFIPNREPYVLAAFEDNDLFNRSLGAPVFNVNGSYQHGGYVSTSDTISISNPGSGTIYYTLDGNDPRLPASLSPPGSEVTLVTENATKQYLVPTGPVIGTGTILREFWTGIVGSAVSDLTSSPDFPDYPTGSGLLTSFEGQTNWMNMYGMRVRGLLHPPTSGSYTFWIASDDNSELWLSTDEDPCNATLIANVPGYTNSRQWTKYPEQQSSSKSLVDSQKYYIEALMKENINNDNLAVAWEGPGITQRVIEGQHLSPVDVDENWFTDDFDDSGWPSGTGGVGYERNPGDPINFIGLFNIDVEAGMYDGGSNPNANTSCYIRIPFTGSSAEFNNMTLKVRYDDGFIAYLNGVEVARRIFPEGQTPQWNSSTYPDQHGDGPAIDFENIDISDRINLLREGDNVLAIHGMNYSTTSSDFLISAELVATEMSYGDVSPDAIEYSGGFNLDKSTNLKSRVYKSSTQQWSALNEAIYALPEVADNVRITEIMYHPQDTNDPNDPNEEFIELKNIGASAINLNLVSFTEGIHFTFPILELAAGGHILIVKNQNAFEAEYGTGKPIAGVYSGSLANGGERIKLEDAMGTTILDFEYGDGWRPITDGDGYSLTIVDATNPDVNSWSEKDYWRASAYINGSPGADDSGIIPNPGDIVINEVMTHSHGEAPDWIELYNNSAGSINIGGWYLSDNDSNLMKYRIADGTTINSGDYLVFYEDANFGQASSDPGCLIPFALSENGETVCLTSALDANGILTGYRQREDFGASETGVSFGRYYKASTNNFNFVSMDYNTPGQANAYPKVGPIVISEIMYHPDWPVEGNHTNDEYEYIELYNISTEDVNLYDGYEGAPWKFTDGIDYTFPDEVNIPAGGRIVVVKDIDAFTWRYPGVPTNIIHGPYSGWLANGGEKVELSKPGDEYLGTRYYIRVDRVSYSDGSHPQDCPGGVDLWPIEADGSGDSLASIDPNLYGNDPNNWAAASPSPGATNP